MLSLLVIHSCKTTHDRAQTFHQDSLCLVMVEDMRFGADSIVFWQQVETIATADSVPHRTTTTRQTIYRPHASRKDSVSSQTVAKDSAIRASEVVLAPDGDDGQSWLHQLALVILGLLGIILLVQSRNSDA